MKKWVITVVAITLASFLFLAHYSFHFETKEYSLSEVEPGTYCIYSVVSSRVPSANYKMVTLCCNGQIVTFKGSVAIIYSASSPRAIIDDYHIVNGDKIKVFVPVGTIKFQENIGIG